MQLADGDAGSVMLLSEDGEWLIVKAAIGPHAELSWASASLPTQASRARR